MSDEPPSNAGRKKDGTFAPGYRANPGGKKPGTRHRATLMAERLLDKDAAAILKTLVEKAKAGEPWAARFVAERIIPVMRTRPTPFELPKIDGPADLPGAVQAVIEASSRGDLSLEDASQVVALLTGLRQAYEGASMVARMDEMQAMLDALTNRAGSGP